jgi:hypothetical protein
MNEPSRPIPIASSVVEHRVGRIVAVEDGVFVVHTSEGVLRAARAFSCLVEPVVGDRVGVLTAAGEVGHVIAVLDRMHTTSARLSLPGDITLDAPEGSIGLRARDGLKLAAPRMEVRAGEGDLVFGRLAYRGDAVRAHVDRIDVVSSVMTKVADHVRETVARSFRFVRELDQLRAARIDYVAEKNVSLRGANAVVTAQELVKMDADQIHIG